MTFRTNRKDRQLFAKALGLEVYSDYLSPEGNASEMLFGAYARDKGKWKFLGNGFEWCMEVMLKKNELIDPRFQYDKSVFGCEFFDMDEGITVAEASGKSIGEAFFRAVVEFERGK